MLDADESGECCGIKMAYGSGFATRRLDLDFEDESESTVHVMVHDLKPPFLDGRTVYTKQLEPINPIRDATSDMAVFSKKGSALVKEKREQAERAKAAAKIAGLGGTALGNVLGGTLIDAGGRLGLPLLPWLTLMAVGVLTALGLRWALREVPGREVAEGAPI